MPFKMTPAEERQAHLFGSKENVILYRYGNQALFDYLQRQRKFWAWVEKEKAKRLKSA